MAQNSQDGTTSEGTGDFRRSGPMSWGGRRNLPRPTSSDRIPIPNEARAAEEVACDVVRSSSPATPAPTQPAVHTSSPVPPLGSTCDKRDAPGGCSWGRSRQYPR